ncbi:MAG: HEAT repeat domain-containing protein [Deltaproteobacteria bacterium]
METEIQGRSGFMGGVATVLNAGGNAVIIVYDAAASVLLKLIETAKKAPDLHEKTKDLITKGIGIVKPGEITRIEKKITEYETQIKQLYFEIGKEGANFSGDERPLESDVVKKLITDVKEYEREIQRLQTRIVDIKDDKAAASLLKKEQKKTAGLSEIKEKAKKDKATNEQIIRLVDAAIKKAIKGGEFESLSEMEIFSKVAGDFLDSEMEIKCLAAAELGKIGNTAAVPILLEAVKFENLDLTSEVINSLITIGDARAIPLFKQEVVSSKHRVRIGCLRGLYKLADNEDAMPLLIEALRDGHPEVRRTALTFIGWKDYVGAVPSVIQCLRDEEPRVRRAAVSTLANLKDSAAVPHLINVLGDRDIEVREKALEALKVISGEDISFDIHASRSALIEAINSFKDWWQKERLGNDKLCTTGQTVDVEVPTDEAYISETEENAPAVEAEVAATDMDIAISEFVSIEPDEKSFEEKSQSVADDGASEEIEHTPEDVAPMVEVEVPTDETYIAETEDNAPAVEAEIAATGMETEISELIETEENAFQDASDAASEDDISEESYHTLEKAEPTVEVAVPTDEAYITATEDKSTAVEAEIAATGMETGITELLSIASGITEILSIESEKKSFQDTAAAVTEDGAHEENNHTSEMLELLSHSRGENDGF